MTLGYCFECTKEMPTSQLKRCARCRMTTYCSRECQKKSWSEFHKYSCKPHDALEEGFRDPAIGTEEWKRLSTDNLINKWIGSWREVFGTCAVTTLDLANHPPDRIATHCLKAVVYLNRDPNTRSGSRLFQVLDARVCPIKELGEEFPNLFENVDLPGDSDEGLRLFRIRYVVFFGLPLQTDSGPMVNTFSRTVHWFDLRVQKLRQRMIDSPPPDWPTPETWLKMITTAVKDGDTTAFSSWSSKLAEMSHIERDELSGLLTY